MDALKEIQSRFYMDFPPHPKEQVYGFATPSSMKPTQWTCKFFLAVLTNFKAKEIALILAGSPLCCRSRRWDQSNSS